ncbi:MAG: protein translocase subunit SecF [Cyanobacteria bacterium NC_groundwater_1444_Ag_S-0.65um_54_12]|nr:protein translocase subunit SecF [Cyanobacteria bacterium NC_groundwater_1444_Ag_S-0.65um_54_12]
MAEQPQTNVTAYTSPEVKIDVMSRKYLWFAISGLLLIPGIIAIIICSSRFHAPVKLGIDFTGGSLLQVRFEQQVSIEQFRHALGTVRIAGEHLNGEIQSEIETAQRTATGSTLATAGNGSTLILRTKALAREHVAELQQALANPDLKLGNFITERSETVGPKIGSELLRNALIALATGILAILGYIAFRYQFDFAVCAIAAMVHDVLIMVGAFALMSLTLGAEADGLLVTALLTVMGFSVHDTIVIFDRFRENLLYAKKGDAFADIANRSVNQTFVRSINTSLTVVLTLLPLVLFGGSSIFFFALSMLIGVVSGTYSSIFNAAPLLVIWRDGWQKKNPPAVAVTATPSSAT